MVSLQLPESLNQTNVSAYLSPYLKQIRDAENSTDVLIDAHQLVQFDSSALALLLALRREALQQHRKIHISNLPATLRSLAQVYGVLQLLQSEGGVTP